MEFFKSILLSALLSGIVAGFALTGLQTLKVYPLIFAAEVFENAGQSEAGHAHDQVDKDADDEWAPADGAERLLYSLLANVLLGVALGLVLAAIFALRGVVDWRQGVIWGLAGFVAVHLAPAFGLPPELPGMPAGDLLARQTWWFATALLTAGGMALIFLGTAMIWRLVGTAMIVLPHIYGAPHPATMESGVPATLAADFATASLATNLVFWAILGNLAAIAMARLSRGDTAAEFV
ncbi:MAG: CbtA family protein [Alphaproteobacteria bacterium]|nr:CbtA family protein [Alphaproteobacteria bacterium]